MGWDGMGLVGGSISDPNDVGLRRMSQTLLTAGWDSTPTFLSLLCIYLVCIARSNILSKISLCLDFDIYKPFYAQVS